VFFPVPPRQKPELPPPVENRPPEVVDVPVRRLDGFAALAFGLAVAIMVLPTEADILVGLFMQRRIALAGLLAALCSTAVLVPLAVSWRRQRSRPKAWRGRGYLFAATGIFVMNALFFGTALIGEWFR